MFKGSATVEFNVERAETSVNTYEALIAALGDYNYNKVTCNATYLNGDLTVPKGYVLVIPAGGRLSNGQYSVEVDGGIENNGEYVNTSPAAALTINDGGSFVNNGSCYFNDVAPEGVSGDGAVYIRENIAEVTELHIIMPHITQPSTAKLTIKAAGAAEMEQAFEILMKIAEEKHLLIVDEMEDEP